MQGRPTHSTVSQFLASLLPPKPNDIPFLYHVPRNPKYDPNTALVEQIVLSVTPTPRVYNLIGYHAPQPKVGPDPAARAILPRPPRTLCFLHRPFDLDRRSVRRGALVLASHTSFDEYLTVGWNTALAARLGVNVNESLCVQGYKGDVERKIGVVGRIPACENSLLGQIRREFGGVEFLQEGSLDEVSVVAIMNAFHAEEVYRVFEMARQRGWVNGWDLQARNILYLTGQLRESGMVAANELGMTVACVGHKRAEEWGIGYLASCLRDEFQNVDVKEVYEEPEAQK